MNCELFCERCTKDYTIDIDDTLANACKLKEPQNERLPESSEWLLPAPRCELPILPESAEHL